MTEPRRGSVPKQRDWKLGLILPNLDKALRRYQIPDYTALARRAQIGRNTMNAAVQPNAEVTAAVVRKMAKALDVPPDFIAGWSEVK